MSDKPTPIKDALAPFSGAADTLTDSHPPDFILRSSDGVDFHVHREILKFASDCFDAMFSVAGSDGDPTALLRDGKPILVLPEPESALYRLLCPAYPARSPEQYTLGVEDLDGLVAVHEAAHKYQFICVQRLIERMLDNPTLIDAQPHRLFVTRAALRSPQSGSKGGAVNLEVPSVSYSGIRRNATSDLGGRPQTLRIS
ncbi:hypothetical protein B0H13DRAFT_2662557 [Mycena leptocephala]|nr:hypothetical protein B0H13DRAFT_2662557 [Mycena leptocephala]